MMWMNTKMCEMNKSHVWSQRICPKVQQLKKDMNDTRRERFLGKNETGKKKDPKTTQKQNQAYLI